MHAFGAKLSLALVALLLSILAQLSSARPSERYEVIQQDDLEPRARPVFLENWLQRIYRNGDHDAYVNLADVRTRSEESKAGAPAIRSIKYLGASQAEPDSAWLDVPNVPLHPLPANMYQTHKDKQLSMSSKYSAIYAGSGAVRLNSTTKKTKKKLNCKPRMSRDGGLGGRVNGQNVFIFADTETHSPDGAFTGFVSNSAASFPSGQVKSGHAPTLQDKMGGWASGNGALRNWIPFTEGEAAYNEKMMGQGMRYAIWPQSSLIPIDAKSAYLYAPIVFTNTVGGTATFSSTGVTLLKVTVPGEEGPVAERKVPFLFEGQPNVEWGVVGGIHGYGPAGASGGKLYILGNHNGGLMLGRVDIKKAENRKAYEFWRKDGSWTSTAPGPSADDNFVDGYFSSVDIFYSPHHKTFIMVHMTPFADNKFYWRYLQSPSPIEPSKADDFVENIIKHPWSEEKVLFEIPHVPAGLYSYSGGMYRGYFNKDDISLGGTKMLIGWAQPTGKDASSRETGFQHKSAEVTFE